MKSKSKGMENEGPVKPVSMPELFDNKTSSDTESSVRALCLFQACTMPSRPPSSQAPVICLDKVQGKPASDSYRARKSSPPKASSSESQGPIEVISL